MTISPFGWHDATVPYLSAANLEAMLQNAGSYTDALAAQKDQPSGYAGLDAGGLLKVAEIPPAGEGVTAFLTPSGGDDSAAMIAALTNFAPAARPVIRLGAGTFQWNNPVANTVPKIARNVGAVIYGAGRQATTVRLSANTPRFCDPGKVADYDLFQNIEIHDFTINDNNVGGTNHKIIGALSTPFVDMQSLNWANVRIWNIDVINVPAGSVSTGGTSVGVHIVNTIRNTDTQACTTSNIAIDNVRVFGGRQGFDVAAFGTVAGSFTPQITGVRITNCYHDTGLIPSVVPGATSWANFQVGGKAQCDNVFLQNLEGHGSNDVGIELDNIVNLTMLNAHFYDAFNAPFYFTNLNPVTLPAQAKWVVRDCTATNNNNYAGQGFILFPNGVAVNPGGDYLFDNCVVESDGVTTIGGAGTGSFYKDFNGFVVGSSSTLGQFRSLTFRDCRTVLTNTTWNTTIPQQNVNCFILNTAPTGGLLPTINFEGQNEIVINGTRSGTATVNPRGILFATCSAQVEGRQGSLVVDLNIVGQSNSSTNLVWVGSATSTVWGDLPAVKVRQWSGDTTPQALTVAATTTLTIAPHILRARGWDIQAMPAGTVIASVAGTQPPNVQLDNWTTPTYPQANPAATTVTASPFTYQAAKFTELMAITGGTVSSITLNGATVATTTNQIVELVSGDTLVVTYSVVPTMQRVIKR